jgi:hypothetical protein
MTPGTSSWSDPALVTGQSYSDLDAGVTLTVLSADSTGASVSVTFGGGGGGGSTTCVPAAPSVSLSPTIQWVVGYTGNYTLTVTNNDSNACTDSSFSVSMALPSGWTAQLTSLLALAPGSSASTNVQVTAPSGTADGFYNITGTATNNSNLSYSGSASATEVCCSGTLAVKVTTDQSSYTQNSWVTITANVRVGQSAVAGADVTVTLQRQGSNVAVLSGSTDGSGNFVIKYKLANNAATGTYQVAASATANGYTGSDNTATFTVTGSGGSSTTSTGGGYGKGGKPK